MDKVNLSRFQQRVYDVVRRIPRGKTMTYKEVALAIGHPKAYRAVGNALNKNPYVPSAVPCHRVIGSGNHLGGYTHGRRKKIAILKKEGVKIESLE